jgi:putative methyltransferase (TIGR04325 family)
LGNLYQILSFARDVRGALRFRGRFYTNLYRGVYASYAEATQAIPSQALKGFEHDVVIKFFEGEEGQWKYHDYPAAFWLREALKTENSVFDLGGGWGQGFYAYRDYIDFPRNLCWLVCDTQAFTDRGREIAAMRAESHLKFTVDPTDANGCGILLTGGTLQYMEDDLPVILDRLDKKPNHIIAHRVPLYDGPQFYTVQRMVYSYAVNKVMNKEQFIKRVIERGYILRDSWAQSRSLKVMFHPERLVPDYSGFYFVLNNGSSSSTDEQQLVPST